MIGGDMPGFDEFTLGLLKNPGILEMHRLARRSRQAKRERDEAGELAVWTADREGGGRYAALFNLGDGPRKVVPGLEPGFEQADTLTDLWSGETVSASAPVTLPPHGAAAYRIG